MHLLAVSNWCDDAVEPFRVDESVVVAGFSDDRIIRRWLSYPA